MIRCPHCGGDVKEDRVYCTQCGRSLRSEPPAGVGVRPLPDAIEAPTKRWAKILLAVLALAGAGLITVLLIVREEEPNQAPRRTAPISAQTTALPLHPGLIAFASFRNQNWDIFTIAPDGSGETNITNAPRDDGFPHWSPDGRQIVFRTNRDGNEDVYLMNPDGSGLRNLTRTNADESVPSFSPDGSQIIFESNRSGNFDIWVMRADGSDPRNLTKSPKDDRYPGFSPDGKQVTFMSNRDGNDEIYRMNADGSAQSRLTNHPAIDAYPVWSPLGDRIGFLSTRIERHQVYTMKPDGTDVRVVTSNPGGYFFNFSPDGKQILFQSTASEEIFVIGVDGSGQQRITNNDVPDHEPSWQPLR